MRVTARGVADGCGGAALIAYSSLPDGLSTTSHPPACSRARIASASAKLRARLSATRSSRSLLASALSVLLGFDRGGQRRHDLQRVADHAKVRHLHDRRLGVLVAG